MSQRDSTAERGTDVEQLPLVLDGVSHEDLTTGFLREIHRAADEEGISLENISVGTR